MSQSYPHGPRSDRPFIVTPYVPGPDGRLVAQLPSSCPISGECGATGCRLSVRQYRPRKTGPRHRLTVVSCATHDCTFTLYPPGYAPYRRQPVLRVAPDGRPIVGEGSGGQPDNLEGTVFEAAVEARSGRPWARESCSHSPDRWWGTQGRHLALAACLVGVARELGDRVRSSIATVLSVDTLRLREGARAVGYRAIGEAICAVLAQLSGGSRRAQQLLLCGHLAGSWGEPLHWDSERRVLERSPFRPPRTEAPG